MGDMPGGAYKNRFGTFKVTTDVVNKYPEVVQRIMAEVVVVRCEHLYGEQVFLYHVFSLAFDEIGPGLVAPEYDPAYDQEADTVTWTRKE